MQKFSELEYCRPDMEAFKKTYEELVDRFQASETPEESKEILLLIEKHNSELDTTSTLAYIRNTLDTTDEFYEKEIAFFMYFSGYSSCRSDTCECFIM